MGFANLAVHLSKFEQGNLAFINLLQKGALHRLYNEYLNQDRREEFKDVLINIFAYLFTNKPLPIFTYDDISEAVNYLFYKLFSFFSLF